MQIDSLTQDRINDCIKQYLSLQTEVEKISFSSRGNKDIFKQIKEIEPIYHLSSAIQNKQAELEECETILSSEEEDKQFKAMAQEEKISLGLAIGELLEKFLQIIKQKSDDDKNVIMEIRAATGGNEASLFVADLFRMYSRYAEKCDYRLEVLNFSNSGIKGYKEIVFMINGKDAYRNLKYEMGVHRVQRVPETEANGRIHTSTVTVAAFPEIEEQDIAIRDEDLRIDTFRSSGAGGQHVNTTDSAVRITHLPTNIVVSCQDEKSQIKNRAKAMKVLRSRVYDDARTKEKKDKDTLRKKQIGTGDRSEKIRTYNFPQNRVTDHRVNKTLHKLDAFLNGEIDDITKVLLQNE